MCSDEAVRVFCATLCDEIPGSAVAWEFRDHADGLPHAAHVCGPAGTRRALGSFAQHQDRAYALARETPHEAVIVTDSDGMLPDNAPQASWRPPFAERVADAPERTPRAAALGVSTVGGAGAVLSVVCGPDTPIAAQKQMVAALRRRASTFPGLVWSRAQRMREADAQLSLLVDALEVPALLCTGDMRLVKANIPAQRYLSMVQEVDGEGAASCGTAYQAEAAPLSGQLAEVVTRLKNAGEDSLATSYVDAQGNFVLAKVLRRSRVSMQDPIYVLQREAEGLPAELYVATLRIARRALPHLEDEAIRAFKITPAERRLLEGLMSGDSLSDIAKAKQLSYNTLRNQLASVTNKTGLRNQADVIRFFASLH